jgi:FkbM family methyltransferase
MITTLRKIKQILLSNDLLKRSFKKIVGKFNLNIKIKVNNRKFIVPIINNVGLSNLTLNELWFPDLLENILKIKKGIFLDIGANTGQTLLELRSVESDMIYYGFEPNPFCSSYCLNLIKLNKIKNSFIIPVGIYHENSILNMYLVSEADSGGTIIEDLRPGHRLNEKYFVPLMRFSDVNKTINFNDVSIIKIDVEGSELQVLESFEGIINECKPIIICEILWAHNEAKLDFFEEKNLIIIKFLKKIHYNIYRIIKTDKGNKIKSLIKLDKIENQIYSSDNMDFCDYLFINENNENKEIKLFLKKDTNRPNI